MNPKKRLEELVTPGDRIRYYRDQAGLSQKEFADAIGISAPSLSELETNESKEPKAATLLKAAAKLKLEPLYVLTGDGPAMRTLDQLEPGELRLLLMYRQMKPPSRIELETEANQLHAQDNPGSKSQANPFGGKVTKATPSRGVAPRGKGKAKEPREKIRG